MTLIFPLSYLFANIFMVIWIYNGNLEVGKLFMLFNFMSIYIHLVAISFAIYNLANKVKKLSLR